MAIGMNEVMWKAPAVLRKDLTNTIRSAALPASRTRSQPLILPAAPTKLSSDFLSLHIGWNPDCSSQQNGISCNSGRRPFTAALLEREEVGFKNLHQILDETADELVEDMNGLNIFLIGMMGCGKSTVGRVLSDSLGYTFFDSDTMVEKSVGTTVASIFQDQGEAAFRDLEAQAISQLSSMEGLVISTGGGAILRDDNWSSMRSGITVWIDVPLEDLARRVVSAGIGSRPILSKGLASAEDAYDQAFKRLHEVYLTREEMYLRADVRVSLDTVAESLELDSVKDLSPELITLQVMAAVKEFLHLRTQELEGEQVRESIGALCMMAPMEHEVGAGLQNLTCSQ